MPSGSCHTRIVLRQTLFNILGATDVIPAVFLTLQYVDEVQDQAMVEIEGFEPSTFPIVIGTLSRQIKQAIWWR